MKSVSLMALKNIEIKLAMDLARPGQGQRPSGTPDFILDQIITLKPAHRSILRNKVPEKTWKD